MQVININHVPYNIPISWAECTYIQAINVIKNVNNKAEQLKALSGIDVDIIESLSNRQAEILFNFIQFTEDLTPFETDNVEDKYKDFDFGAIAYGTAEKIKKAVNENVTGFDIAISIIKILYDEDISNKPFLEVIGNANFFLGNTLISITVLPNLDKIHLAMNKSPLEFSDSLVLEGLQRTLKSRDPAQSAEQ